jgi:hypothetical protein
MPSAYSYFLDDADAILVASASRRAASTPPAQASHPSGRGTCSFRPRRSCTAPGWRTRRAWAGRTIGWRWQPRPRPYANARAALEGLEPGVLAASMDSAILRRARSELPLRRDEKPWILASELARHVPLLGALRGEHVMQNE